jgi:hypothetical protein
MDILFVPPRGILLPPLECDWLYDCPRAHELFFCADDSGVSTHAPRQNHSSHDRCARDGLGTDSALPSGTDRRRA